MHAPFKIRKLSFEQSTGWVAAATVVIIAELQGTLLLKGSRLINGRYDRPIRIGAVGRTHTARSRLILHAQASSSANSSVSSAVARRLRSKRSAITASVVGQRPAPAPETTI